MALLCLRQQMEVGEPVLSLERRKDVCEVGGNTAVMQRSWSDAGGKGSLDRCHHQARMPKADGVAER